MVPWTGKAARGDPYDGSMAPPEAPTPANLLAHAGFVRALARAALRGDAECEDLEQDVWVAAIEGAPARQEDQRGWLAAVVRNHAVDLFRRRSRRAARERCAARPEAVAGPEDVVARAEVGRRLVAAALALEEPSRTAILLRFFDDLPPREVAARLGVPVETVRTRTKRGLERLRARLEHEWRAEDRDWRRALRHSQRAAPSVEPCYQLWEVRSWPRRRLSPRCCSCSSAGARTSRCECWIAARSRHP